MDVHAGRLADYWLRRGAKLGLKVGAVYPLAVVLGMMVVQSRTERIEIGGSADAARALVTFVLMGLLAAFVGGLVGLTYGLVVALATIPASAVALRLTRGPASHVVGSLAMGILPGSVSLFTSDWFVGRGPSLLAAAAAIATHYQTLQFWTTEHQPHAPSAHKSLDRTESTFVIQSLRSFDHYLKR